MYLMRQNCFKLVSAIKFLFLFCMIYYSQKTLIDHGFIVPKIQKIVLNIHKKLSECLLIKKMLKSTRVLALGLWILVL